MEKTIEALKKEIDIFKQNNEKRRSEPRPMSGIQSMFQRGFDQGGASGGKDDDTVANLRKRFESMDLPEETKTIVEKELKNLSRLRPSHHEYSNIENYLETLADLPWNVFDEENTDVAVAQKVLDADHYGLEKVKKRIVEFLAVSTLTTSQKGSILCFVGPPGVGKTSLGKSIAKAMNRKFY